MRVIEAKISKAFNGGESLTIDNTMTDGTSVYLHDNEIIRKVGNSIEISTAGWPTRTTKSRLKSIAGASVYTSKGQLYLNDSPWDGNWKAV